MGGEDGGKMLAYNGSMSTRVLLVSRGMFHDGLVRVLDAQAADIEIVGSAENWDEAKALIERLQPEAIIADYRYAEEMMADMEQMAHDAAMPGKILFIILDENKIILYQRKQFTDITIDRLIEAL